MLGAPGGPLEGITLPVVKEGGRREWRLSPHEITSPLVVTYMVKLMGEVAVSRVNDPMTGGAVITWTPKDLRPVYPHPTDEPY